MTVKPMSRWWERQDLGYRAGRLFLGNQDLAGLAAVVGTPIFVYHADRVKENLTRLQQALGRHHIRHKIFYALKANRFLPLVTYLKLTGQCGLDVCSPGELLLARQIGFAESEITYTGTSLSNQDLDLLQRHQGIQLNCDSLSSLNRLGQRCPGRTIGLRINPQLGAGYHQALRYAGAKATKFGIYQNRFQEALDLARRYDLTVRTLHFHCGSGYLTNQLDTIDQIWQRVQWFLDQCPSINTVDIGGGLGLPLGPEDEPLDLERWAAIIAKYSQPRNLTIQVEPGDYLVKDAGVLILEVNSVEEKGGTTFVGVNGGFNLQNLAVYYQTPCQVAPLRLNQPSPLSRVTIAGNINEAIDLFAEDILLPPLAEGDWLGLLNVGGYGTASSSNHCMRGQFAEYLVFSEGAAAG